MWARTRLTGWRGPAILAIIGGALIVAACSGDMGDQSASRGGGGGDGQALAPPAEGDAPSNEAPDDGSDGSLPQPQVQDRKIVRNATLELQVDDVSAAVQQVEDAAVAAGGFVSSSNVFVSNTDDAGDSVERTETASVTVRVPADAYSSVMRQLRGLAMETVSETSDASEVTEEYTDLQARLRNLEATEARYLELLGRAGTIDEILMMEDRLNNVRLEIEQVTGRINVLNSLTEFATITARLSLQPAVAQVSTNDRNWAEEAWHVSWQASQDTLVVLGTVAIAGGVLLAWLAVPALVLLIVWRFFGRRIVEAARKPSQT